MTAKLFEPWIVQPYQHGRIDTCEGPLSFETEADALAYAKDWASTIPYTGNTEHECVVFKAAASFRGRLTPQKHQVAALSDPSGE